MNYKIITEERTEAFKEQKEAKKFINQFRELHEKKKVHHLH